MANKVLDLLLRLTVQGTDQAKALENAIEAIAEEMKGLKGSKSLDDILGIIGTETRVKQLTASVKALFAAGKLGFDLDLSKPFIKAGESIDVVRAKIRAVAEDAKKLFEIEQAKKAAAQTAVWTAELGKLQEKAAGAAIALEREAQAAKELDAKKKAAETAAWTAEMDRLKEAAAGAAIKLTQIRTNTLERLKEAAAAAKPPLDALDKQIEKLRAALASGREIKFDLDVSKPIGELERLQGQLREIKEKFLSKGQDLRINTSTARKDIGDVIQSLLQTQRALQELTKNSVRLNINSKDAITLREALESVNVQLALAQQRAKAFAAGGAIFSQFTQEAEQARKGSANLRSEVGTLTRDFLFFRRAIFGLGFSFVARELVQVAIQFDNMRQSLSAVFGTTAKANEQFDFLVATADRLGLSLTSITDRFNKLSIAGREAGLSHEIIKDNFLAVAEAGARLHLSIEQVDGALLALEQIASKGKVSMEELRRQLGNALPGAMSIAAKALGITTEKLFELVENGQLASNVFLKVFPSAIRAAFSVDTNTRIDTTQAAINRFINAIKTLVDTVVRAGALDAFTQVLTDLSKVAKDPATIQFLKDFSAGLKSLTAFVTQNITVIRDLLGAYLLFKGLKFIGGVLASIGTAFTGLTQAARGVRSTAVDFDVTTGAATRAATGIDKAKVALGRFAALAANPIVIAVAFVGVELLLKHWRDINAAQEKAAALEDARRESEKDNRVAENFRKAAVALGGFNDVAIKSAKQIKELSADALPGLQRETEGAIASAKAHVKAIDAQIQAHASELALLKLKGPLTDAERIQQEHLIALTEDLTEKRALAVGLETQYAAMLQRVANAQGNVFIASENLSGAIQSQITLFDQAIKSGKGLRESLDKAIPDSFSLGGVQAIADVAATMERLQQQASVTGKVIEEELGKKLNALSGQELSLFIANAQKGFADLTISAKGLGLVLGGATRAALKNLGEDVETVGTGVSKSFLDMAQSFKALTEAGDLAGAQLAGALDKVIEAAKTEAEVSFLKAIITATGIEAKNMGAAIEDSLNKLAAKSREVAGVVDTFLAGAFKRLGLQTQKQVSANLAQMIIDFRETSKSAEVMGTTIADSFIKIRDAVLAAGGSNTQLIESAILARTRVRELFDEGKLNAAQFIEEMGKVRIATANTFSDPLNVAGVAFREFGIRTRAELTAIAQTAQEKFNLAAASGQFSARELQKAADDVEQKWLEAFGNIEEAAQAAFSNISSFSMLRRDIPAFDAAGLKLASIDELKTALKDLEAQAAFQTRPGSVVDPVFLRTLMQAIQQLINELNRRGENTGLASKPVAVNNGTFNLNFYGGQPDDRWVRNFLIPQLDAYWARRA